MLTGKISWFGGPNDPSAQGTPASGIPITQPGIAVYDHSTLGGWWRVTTPNGRTAVVQQTDIGPAPWTGRKIDFTYSALPLFGYTQGNFPTNATATTTYLGKRRPAGAGATKTSSGAGTVTSAPIAGTTSSSPAAGPAGSDLFGSHHSELLYATVWLGAAIMAVYLLGQGLNRATHGSITRASQRAKTAAKAAAAA